jgi:hypothetical protein
MPECPRDNDYITKPPPGFTQDSLPLKRVQLIELLEKVRDKYQQEPQFVEQLPKQTDLLFSIAQFTLLPASNEGKRNFLNNIVMIAQDLLLDENQDVTMTTLPSNTPDNEEDGGLSLDDLANEYLQNEPSPSSLNDQPTTSSESDVTLDDLGKIYSSSAPSISVLSNLILSPVLTESIGKSPLESILFSNRLSSHDAADDADLIWKEESSPFGQIFCKKSTESPTQVTKQISTCLFDRSLYERLTRLIALLPKQCIRNSVPQLPIRYNGQQQQQSQFRQPRPYNDNRRPSNRPTFDQNASYGYQTQRYPSARPYNDVRRPSNRPTFDQNASQAYPMQRYPPPPQNPRQYTNSTYSNQEGNPGGNFVDQRQQQQYRHPNQPPTFASNTNDYQQQQPPRGPPRNNAHGGGGQQQQQKKKPPASASQNNQQTTNQNRGPKKGGGGGGKYSPFVLVYFYKKINNNNKNHLCLLFNQ